MILRLTILTVFTIYSASIIGQNKSYVRHHADTIFCNLNPYIDSLDTIIHIDTIGFLYGSNKDSIYGFAFSQQAGTYTPDSCSILNNYFISYIIAKIATYKPSGSDSLWAELYVDSLDNTPEYISPFKVPITQSDTPTWYLLWLPTPAFTSPTTVWIAVRWTTHSDSVFSFVSHPLPSKDTLSRFFFKGNKWLPDSLMNYPDTTKMFKPLIFTVASGVTSVNKPVPMQNCHYTTAFSFSGQQITYQTNHNAFQTHISGPAVIILPDSRKILSPTGYFRCH